MPYPYSSTWNLQCKAATDTLKEMQRGLKLHNAFAHWRHGSDDVWCGFLYFIIALMDKWVALIAGGSFVGFSDADSSTFRLAVGFGLPYYLMAAICLDVIAQPLWLKAGQSVNLPIDSRLGLQNSVLADARARKSLYWRNLAKFLILHVWSVAVATSLMWTFEKSQDGTQMFLAYIGAYTGLLYFQYNRIFCGIRVLSDLIPAAILGLVVGPILVRCLPGFAYSTVVALALATWTAALLSFRTANISLPRISEPSVSTESARTGDPEHERSPHTSRLDTKPSLLEDDPATRQDPARKLDLMMLGIDCDTEWDALPHRIKTLLLHRLQGDVVQLDNEHVDWLCERFGVSDITAVERHIELCDQALAAQSGEPTASNYDKASEGLAIHALALSETRALPSSTSSRNWLRNTTKALISVYETLGWIVKILVVCLVADPELQRELDYLISCKHIFLRGPIKVTTCGLWMYCKALQRVILPFFLVSRFPSHFFASSSV